MNATTESSQYATKRRCGNSSPIIWRYTGLEKDHRAMQTWMRRTAGYRRIRGG
jgi:hypothetical protein